MMERVYNFILLAIVLILVYISHIDRVVFVEELRDSRNLYLEAITNIEIIREDLTIIKSAVLKKGD